MAQGQPSAEHQDRDFSIDSVYFNFSYNRADLKSGVSPTRTTITNHSHHLFMTFYSCIRAMSRLCRSGQFPSPSTSPA